ncbi:MULTISPECIES: glucosylglycerol hydrolase [unclassified Coleofasciculus]|uniref:glucosylglycerol hydrolase n=1 Tax=unclassified Coleofasciculus TaxID=2692782 RepID=UPI001882BDE3|nr:MULTISPECIES: glucosylglycerol hydrolase [unclassified Coleofasciculus]MBE9124654.1 alpha-amylase [Coleofasciculus sp. LEGE 07081]MBE9146981.1 alpha-amylase [Coleofasciculus sp. LEGE 07092]
MTATVKTRTPISLVEDETQKLLAWAEQVNQSDETIFRKAQILATRLGAHYRADGLTDIGFWAPELGADMIQPKNIYLEVLTPIHKIDPTAPLQKVKFHREHLQLEKQGEYFWGVLSGMRPGTKDQMGSFYWLCYLDFDNEVRIIGDVLAYSLPYGVYAPAELYDINSLQQNRADLDYFGQGDTNDEGIVRVHPPHNILQLHITTASKEGSLAGLTRIYRRIAEKLSANEPLTPAEQNYIGYDAVQLLPIEPTVEYRAEHELGQGFFIFREDDRYEMNPETEGIEYETEDITIALKKPDTQNWGYDIVIFASSATNPSVLETLRPDELVEFIATLHTFPTRPIQVIFDIVYGHADNQALDLLNGRFLKGPNMYGQDINHQNPTVRAILLEMQGRKNNMGVDGIRVDGAQDFKFFNPFSGRVEYDDIYLKDMAQVLQEIDSHQRLLFAIFEDGRPWPAEGWEEISTYRDIIEYLPEAFQWGPLIFAHNTPGLKKFWDKKWHRVCEVMQVGANWITGCGNHDTLRRGTQVDPDLPINWNLGKTLPEVLNTAYNNPAVTLSIYGFSPGLPMDFINCTMESAWGFFRNTDDRYGVKVAAEEAGFLDWQVEKDVYNQTDIFPRLKQMGFRKIDELRQFMRGLYDAIEETNYDLEAVVNLCQRYLGEESEKEDVKQEATQRKSAAQLQKLNVPDKSQVLTELDVGKLKIFAQAFMEDMHEACNVWNYEEYLVPELTAFNLALRRFRLAHPWLRENLSGVDRFNRISDDDYTIFYGWRSEPLNESGKTPKQIVMVSHMGGEPLTVTIGDWLQLDLDEWQVAIASPGLEVSDLRSFELRDTQALLLERLG